MKVIRDIQDNRGVERPTVVSIGVFDGVHIGHQAVLRATCGRAAALGIDSCVFTFDRHPAQVFAPDKAPYYLSSLEERVRLIGEFGGGVDVIAIARFDKDFSSLSPVEFVDRILVDRLKCREVLVGPDFKFGAKKAGDVGTLRALGPKYGFSTTVLEFVHLEEERASSTQIRGLLADGHLNEAVAMLGHTFTVTGRVVHGKHLGRTIGYPTANLMPLEPWHQVPSSGIYACYAHTEDGQTYRAAVSIGSNPTTDVDGVTKIEAYLMDGFEGELYGQLVTLEFAQRLRDEMKFDTLDALIEQIRSDVLAVERLVSPYSLSS
jgi:riboflavin kinase/FMN adenylyltransferase